MRRYLSLFSFCLVLAGLAALIFLWSPPRVETSLFSLVGDRQLQVPACVRDRSVAQIQVLFSGTNFAETAAVAEKFAGELPQSAYAQIRLKTGEGQLAEILSFYRKHAAGMLAEEDRTLLQKREYARVTRQTLQALFTSPIPSLFPFEEDPFGLMNRFVRDLPLSFSGWQAKDGYLAAEKDGRSYLLMVLTLRQEIVEDLDRLARETDVLRGLQKKFIRGDQKIFLCGVPMHTADVAVRCRQEIQLLSVFSLLFIAGLAVLVFRSIRFLPWIALSLSAACLGGFIALGLAFSTIHLLSCVFATTLLGLTVDYSFHWLLTATPEQQRMIRKNLTSSWLTTEICFLPFAFSGIAVLQQTALFMAVGLTIAYLCVLLFYPREQETFPPWPRVIRGVGWGVGALLIPVAIGLCSLHFHTDVTAFHRPSPPLAAAERLFRNLSGTEDLTRGLLVVQGKSLEEALEREEQISLPKNLPHLARFLPSLERRRENAGRIASLYLSQTNILCRKLQLQQPLKSPAQPVAWQADLVPAIMVSPFLLSDDDGFYTLIPNVEARETWPCGVTFYAPKQVMNRMMNHYSSVCLRLLAISSLVLLLLLVVLFRKRALLISLPSLLAILSVFGLLTLTGQTINLFHLLACFMVIGMSLDYTIFLATDFRVAQKPVVCSLLTSLVGFGALAFVSFPLVQFIGQALGIGLLVSFLTAYALFTPKKEQGHEQGASALGLESAWWVYRILGKRAADLLTRCIATVIWLTHPQARRVTGYRRLLNFALALNDKLVVAANGRGQPKVFLDGSEDARRFEEDVSAKKGVFVISSHLGNVEVLSALGQCKVTFHAFMKVEDTAVFYAFLKRHARRPEAQIHPITGFGMQEVFQFGDLLDAGDCILMAGDRGEGRMREHLFLGKKRKFPVGVFHLAKLLEHPVYFVACIAERGGYRTVAHRLPGDEKMFEAYVTILEKYVQANPDQWYQWEGEESHA